MENSKTKRISVKFPVAKHMEIKIAAIGLGMTISEFVDLAIERFMKEKGLIN